MPEEVVTIQTGATLVSWQDHNALLVRFDPKLPVIAGELEEWGEQLCKDFPFLRYPEMQGGTSRDRPFEVTFKIRTDDGRAVPPASRYFLQRRVGAKYNARGMVSAKVERDGNRNHTGTTLVLAITDNGQFGIPHVNVSGIAEALIRPSAISSSGMSRYELAAAAGVPSYDRWEAMRLLRALGNAFGVYIEQQEVTVIDADPNAQLHQAFDWRGTPLPDKDLTTVDIPD